MGGRSRHPCKKPSTEQDDRCNQYPMPYIRETIFEFFIRITKLPFLDLKNIMGVP